ncbi:MAG: hypothetical protein ABW060_12795 [Solirubrobacteraceae bacterium]
MTSTVLLTTPDGPAAHPADGVHPARDGALDELVPLLGVIAVAGPPVLLLAGPLVLIALMVAGPVVLILTGVALVVGAAGLLGVVLAVPYLLLRAVHARPASPRPAPAWHRLAQVPVTPRRRAA